MSQYLPSHLKKYIVDQNYDRYTPQDQAAWRYCLRQLRQFLSVHGHECYVDGLEKTGISVEEIPHISTISSHIEKFGWRALPVSGFIPPAAFMEMQALGILPIASDMRSVDHILYTPAPDIVHEAAGHAPIIVHPEYAEYLKQYSQVAKKAIISKDDLDLYEAIRILSDTKENPLSTAEDIQKAEEGLHQAIKAISHVSEASQLSRMNWWTAEYGLIGDINNPKIFGAGLLSSVGESRSCLDSKVKKIPLTVDCINQTYDITEPQPQLYVTPDFKTLVKVLHELSEKMAYKVGGTEGLNKAIKALSVNTVQLDTGFQISGVVSSYLADDNNSIIFLKLSGPTQLSFNDKEISGHGTTYHKEGYSTPLGSFTLSSKNIGDSVNMEFSSGFKITGKLKKISPVESTTIYTFSEATATYKNEVYFQPSWGDYDVVCGHKVVSVFGGPADRKNFGDTEDFEAIKVPKPPQYSDEQKAVFKIYSDIRSARQKNTYSSSDIKNIFDAALDKAPLTWLIFIELYEMAVLKKDEQLVSAIQSQLGHIKTKKSELTSVIDDGIQICHA